MKPLVQVDGGIRGVIREGWAKNSACKGMDVNLFFPTKGSVTTALKARKVCASCTVREDCLESGLNQGVSGPLDHGFFGGMSPRDRRPIWVERNKTKRETKAFAKQATLNKGKDK